MEVDLLLVHLEVQQVSQLPFQMVEPVLVVGVDSVSSD